MLSTFVIKHENNIQMRKRERNMNDFNKHKMLFKIYIEHVGFYSLVNYLMKLQRNTSRSKKGINPK